MPHHKFFYWGIIVWWDFDIVITQLVPISYNGPWCSASSEPVLKTKCPFFPFFYLCHKAVFWICHPLHIESADRLSPTHSMCRAVSAHWNIWYAAVFTLSASSCTLSCCVWDVFWTLGLFWIHPFKPSTDVWHYTNPPFSWNYDSTVLFLGFFLRVSLLLFRGFSKGGFSGFDAEWVCMHKLRSCVSSARQNRNYHWMAAFELLLNARLIQEYLTYFIRWVLIFNHCTASLPHRGWYPSSLLERKATAYPKQGPFKW